MTMPFPDYQDVNRGALRVEGTAFTNGSGAVDNTANIGRCFTATRTGVGTMSIKITAVAKAVLHFNAFLSKTAVAARYLQYLGRTQGTDGCWTFLLALTDMTGTAAQEWAAANAANFVTFEAVLQTVSP